MRTFKRVRRSAVQTGLSTGTSTKTEADLVERAKRLGIGIWQFHLGKYSMKVLYGYN